MDNQRLILIIALSMVLFLIWQAWIEEQMVKNPPPLVTEPAGAPAGQTPGADTLQPSGQDDVPIPSAAPAAASSEVETPAVSNSAERIRVTTDQYTAEIDPVGGSLVSVGLRQYPLSLQQPEQPFPLLNANPGNFFAAQSGLVASSGSAPNHYQVYTSAQTSYQLADGQNVLEVPLTWRGPDGVTVTKI